MCVWGGGREGGGGKRVNDGMYACMWRDSVCKYAFFESLTILSLSWWTVGWGGTCIALGTTENKHRTSWPPFGYL